MATTTTTALACYAAVLLLLLVAVLSPVADAASIPASSPTLDNRAITPWIRGRTTFYGSGDGYSIHEGACHYGGIPYPYFVGALSDWDEWNTYQNGAYANNKCGTCFEIQCDPNGRGYCRDDRVNASIIVRVTDRCPCKHENPSNQRWCCGDMPHFDISKQAFGEIASHTGGWVYLQWREVDCPEAIGLGGQLLENPVDWTPFCTADVAVGDANERERTIADEAEERNLTTFAEALWRAGPEVWDAMTTRAMEHTVVAPTNAAFESFAAEMNLTVEELLNDQHINDIMKYHILHDKVDLSEDAVACDDVQPYGNTCAQEKEWGNCERRVKFKDQNTTVPGDDFEANGWCRKTCGFCKRGFPTLLEGVDLAVSHKPVTTAASGNGSNDEEGEAPRSSSRVVFDKGHGPTDVDVVDIVNSCNGNLVVTDSVLYPLCKGAGAKSLIQVAEERGLIRFMQALYKAETIEPGVLGIGQGFGVYTTLSPTEEAWERFLDARGATWEAFLNAPDFMRTMKNHIMPGAHHIGFHEADGCRDIGVPREVVDELPVVEQLWQNASTIPCEELEPLGFCSAPWIAQGYCRLSCGRCHNLSPDGEDRANVTALSDEPLLIQPSGTALLRTYAADADGIASDEARVYHMKVSRTGGGGGAARAFSVRNKKASDALVLVPDLEACNGLLHVIDNVLI